MTFLVKEGYQASGCDFSDNGIRISRERIERLGFSADLRVSEADTLEYPDESFDAVICYGVLYYLPLDRYRKAVSEIHRILRPRGKALVITRTKEDSRFQTAEPVTTNTCVLNLPKAAPSFAEQGMAMTFLEKNDLNPIFSQFSSIVIDRISVTSENGAFRDDDWHLDLTK